MDDSPLIALITVLYGMNTIALVALTTKFNKLEIVVAKLCVRMGCDDN